MTQLVLELGELNISSPDPVLRLETVDLTKQWIDHAVTLGCPRVMVNQARFRRGAPDRHRHFAEDQCVCQNQKGLGDPGKPR